MKTTVTVIQPEPVPTEVQLSISMEDAQVIFGLLCKTSGDLGYNTFKAMKDAGIKKHACTLKLPTLRLWGYS